MMESTCLRLANAVISSSICSAKWCARYYGVKTEDIEVLHTGVDTMLFRPTVREIGGGPRIVFVGRIAASKGVDTLVKAVCRIAPEFAGLRLRLVGRVESAFASVLNGWASQAGCPDLLQFTGFVPPKDLPGQLNKADVFASPSRYEGGPGFTCLEAMACGLPVVACSGSGVAEVIENGRTGILVPPDDPLILSDALRRLLNDASLRACLGSAARHYVETEANAADSARRFEAVYSSIAQSLR